MDREARIWMPSVDIVTTNKQQAVRGTFDTTPRLNTKTSLEANDNLSVQYRNLNREILSKTQAYNSTPKPFRSFDRSSQQPTEIFGKLSENQLQKVKPQLPAQFEQCRNLVEERSEFMNYQQAGHQSSPSKVIDDTQMESHEIVHKQYNSPINLYSMDNIRKSIEAHTEMIAPGLKGINFLKPETPVNKQSEVYKLIKQEEDKQRCASSFTERISPISGEPIATPSDLNHLRNVSNEKIRMVETNQHHKNQQQLRSNVHATAPPTTCAATRMDEIKKALPTCSECGLPILGAFARVLDNSIHAQCFNCTTCGTSLKNSGFFTVNDKLYCELHAKQVAKVLHLNYNFATDQKDQSQTTQSPLPELQLISQPQHNSSSTTTINHQDHATREEKKSSIHHETLAIGSTKIPICCACHTKISGPYIMAGRSMWCKRCSQTSFNCHACKRSLLSVGFIEDSGTGKHYCEHCFEVHFAPICSKCNLRIRGDCLNALGTQWHPSCFVCAHCKRPFGNSSFYLEDNLPYCERDWNQLFTTKCDSCGLAIEAGDKWIEALDKNYHSTCFRCSNCHVTLEGSVFYCKAGKPFCRMHAR